MCLKNALLLLDRLDLSENRVKINSDIASVLRLNRFVSNLGSFVKVRISVGFYGWVLMGIVGQLKCKKSDTKCKCSHFANC